MNDIKNLKISVRIIVFALYNISYVLYMLGLISQSVQLAFLICFCSLNGIVLLFHHSRGKKFTFGNGFKYGIGFIAIIFIISLIYQTINGDFQGYLVDDILRLLLPLVNAFLFINATNENERNAYFNILLFRFVLHFVLQNVGYFNLQTIMSISWENSFSPFESSMAHDFLMLEFYFLYKQQKKKAFLCMILCMFSMKRFSFFLAPIMFILSKKVPIGKQVPPQLLMITKLATIASPLVIIFLYRPEVINWINLTYHMDLNLFMSGRITIYNILVNNIPYYNGLGSINNFLAEFVMGQYGTTWNSVLHNDFLRFYLEVTIIGVIAIAHSLVEITKKEYWSFLMLLYILFVAITSHIFHYFSMWFIFYMALADMCSKNLLLDKKRQY